jgi:thiosulfate dehydrogenase
MSTTNFWSFTVVFFALTGSALAQSGIQNLGYHKSSGDSLSWGILIPGSAGIGRTWEVPRHPMLEHPEDTSQAMKSVRRGFALFMNTSKLAPSLTGGTMSCNNCHPNGGQREKAMPLVGVASIFPEFNKRSGRVFTLEERIVGCLLRSINATGRRNPSIVTRHENELKGSSVNADTREVRDLAAYIRWLSSGLTIGNEIPWRGRNSLPASSLLPIEKLDPKLGKRYFTEWCAYCHGNDGQGLDSAKDLLAGYLHIAHKSPGPLWGPNSWNDGAGAARTYTLAGMIRNWMPYLNPGFLSDEQAQHIAAFITSQSRPGFPYKVKDYLKTRIPIDAVYYKQLYRKNPLTDK